MQDNFNTFSKIEDYLNNNLRKEERIAFEKQLESNPELQTLVDDYNLVDVLIEEAELINVNQTLTKIHKRSLFKRNLLVGIGIAVLAIAVSFYFYNSNKEMTPAKIEIQKETSKSITFLVTEPTPFRIIDSMSERKLTTSIQQSAGETPTPSTVDSIAIKTPKTGGEEETKPTKQPLVSSTKTDSTEVTSPTEPLATTKKNKDSIAPINCNLSLEKESILITNSCTENSTGSIQFTTSDPNYLYSINNGVSYSSNPNFTSIREGNYLVNLKNKSNQCKSKAIELTIEGYTCNYIIHPDQFIYLEKSLDKFKEVNFVEVFVFNRNGNLVFNKKIPTSEKFYWEGNSNTGSSTPMGNYTYLIKSGNKVSTGEITIIR